MSESGVKRRRRLLAGVSLAQLAVGVTGVAVAVRRRRAFDLSILRGSPDTVGRDSLLLGTALSAPAPMLVTQAICIPRAAGGDARAARVLHVLGITMVGGYMAERLGRLRLRPGGFDPVETPLVVAGVGLSAAMTVLGSRRVQG